MDEYGARVEMGILKSREGDRWRVESCTRKGVVTPPIAVLPVWPMCPMLENPMTYQAGDRVYYFVTKEGSGMVLYKIED